MKQVKINIDIEYDYDSKFDILIENYGNDKYFTYETPTSINEILSDDTDFIFTVIYGKYIMVYSK